MTELTTTLDIAQVLESYLQAWNTKDPVERMRLLERSVSDDVIFVDPMVQLAGLNALSAHIAHVRSQYADVFFASGGEPDQHNGYLRQPWIAVKNDEVVLHGTDFDDIGPDGRLTRIIAFFDKA